MQIDRDKLVELGSRLKEKRRGLGLEREEISVRIKISARALHALEEAIPDSLPQPVFAKGFARSYAEALGLDMEEMNAFIAEAFPMEFKDNVKPELSSVAREQSITINQTSNAKLLLLLTPLLLLIIGLAGWFAFKTFFPVQGPGSGAQISRQQGQTVQARPPAAQRPVQAQSPAPVQAPGERPRLPAGNDLSVSVAQASEAATSEAATSEAAPEAGQGEAVSGQALSPPGNQVAQSNARADSPIPENTQRVVLFAKYECWVGAEFDDVGRRSFTLEPGQTFVLDFKQKLTLTLGNSGAVDMSYNGQPHAIGGRFREARVLVFPPQ